MSAGELALEREQQIRRAIEDIPFAKLPGIEVDELASGVARLSLVIKDELKRNYGIVHGGAIASLIDSATAFATLTLLEAGQRTTTVDFTVNFFVLSALEKQPLSQKWSGRDAAYYW